MPVRPYPDRSGPVRLAPYHGDRAGELRPRAARANRAELDTGMTTRTHRLTVPREARGERLDRFLSRALSLRLERVRALVESGAVRIRGRTCAVHRKLFGGEEVEVALAAPRAVAASGPDLVLLYDDPDCAVAAKPAGLPVLPSREGAPSVAGAASRLGGFDVDGHAAPGLPHRLDRDTSGCLLLAKTDAALAALRGAFEAGTIEKEYRVVVAGAPPDRGALDTAYGRSPADPRRFTTRVSSARRARLSFTVLERLGGAALLAVVLDTGRTHQIRVQLAEAGFPVLGDPVYGVPSPAVARQALHAERLAFPRPSDGARVEVRAPLPEDLALALEVLRRGR
jgi:23S rRNA pseudouridine1911/1915/1917 synthase